MTDHDSAVLRALSELLNHAEVTVRRRTEPNGVVVTEVVATRRGDVLTCTTGSTRQQVLGAKFDLLCIDLGELLLRARRECEVRRRTS